MKYDIVTLDPDLEQAQQGGRVSLHVVGSYIIIYPAMTAFTNQYSLLKFKKYLLLKKTLKPLNTHIYLYASTVHMYCIYPAILNRK
jgi:hypothetical protein